MRLLVVVLVLLCASAASSAILLARAQTPPPPANPVDQCRVQSAPGYHVDLNDLQNAAGEDAWYASDSFTWDFFGSFCGQPLTRCRSDIPQCGTCQDGGVSVSNIAMLQKNAQADECHVIASTDPKGITVDSTGALTGLPNQGVNMTIRGGTKTDSGAPRLANILFTCVPTAPVRNHHMQFLGESDVIDPLTKSAARQYLFQVTTSAACDKEGNLGGGSSELVSTLLWFFLFPNVGGFAMMFAAVAVLIYVIVGVIINIKMYDRRGTEALPQWEFWSSLPGLIADGVRFIFEGCMKVTRRGKYRDLDSIE